MPNNTSTGRRGARRLKQRLAVLTAAIVLLVFIGLWIGLFVQVRQLRESVGQDVGLLRRLAAAQGLASRGDAEGTRGALEVALAYARTGDEPPPGVIEQLEAIIGASPDAVASGLVSLQRTVRGRTAKSSAALGNQWDRLHWLGGVSIGLATACFALLVVAQRRRREAEAASQAKAHFLATMSHEVRTPLNGVLGLAEVLETGRLGDRQRDAVRGIRASGQAALTLISQVLEVTRLNSAEITPREVAWAPRDVIEEALAVVAPIAHELGTEVLWFVEPALGDGEPVPEQLTGDPDRVRQVLVNLLHNAVRFTGRGLVTLRATYRRERLILEVDDDGPGVAPSERERIFEAFTQLDRKAGFSPGGAGLGLAICHGLVQLMRGTIGVRDGDGGGSCFSVELPAPIAAGRGGMLPPHPWSAWIISDNQRMAEHLSFVARAAGIEVAGVVPSRAALTEDFRGHAVLIGPDVALEYRRTLVARGGGIDILPPGAAARDDAEHPQLHLPLSRARLLGAMRVGGSTGSVMQRERGHILVVDDVALNREVARRIVELVGFEVELADGGYAALDAVQARRFDAILLDCDMPDLDGWTVSRTIRSMEGPASAVPIVAVTAFTADEDVARCYASGMTRVLSKPLSIEVVREVLETLGVSPGDARV